MTGGALHVPFGRRAGGWSRLMQRLSFWMGAALVVSYGVILVAVFRAYYGCTDECHGGVAIPLFFSFLVPIGAGLIRVGARADSDTRRRPWGLDIGGSFWAAVTCFGAALLVMAAVALVMAIRNLSQAITGWGLAPPGWHPDADDKFSQFRTALMVGGFLFLVGLGGFVAGRRNGHGAQSPEADEPRSR